MRKVGEDPGRELDADEQQLIVAWAAKDTEGRLDGFADRVLVGLDAEAEDERFEHSRNVLSFPSRTWWTVGLATLAAALLLTLLNVAAIESSRAAFEVASSGEQESTLAVSRSRVKQDLERHCAPCHDGASEGHKDAALRAFDLAEARWWSMSEAQLFQSVERLQQQPGADAAVVERVRQWVVSEIRSRASSPA